MPRGLSRSFFARDADIVARDLLGRIVAHEVGGQRVAARIVETEAYFGPPGRNPHLARRRNMPRELRERLLADGDAASHAFPGATRRSSIMYGPPGHAYVYLIYGMHECVNIVTGPEDAPQAVLLRAAEPIAGDDVMCAHRGTRVPAHQLCAGPGRLAKALGITRAHNGADVTRGALRIEAGKRAPDADVRITRRINVVGAEDLALRFVDATSRAVSRTKQKREL